MTPALPDALSITYTIEFRLAKDGPAYAFVPRNACLQARLIERMASEKQSFTNYRLRLFAALLLPEALRRYYLGRICCLV